MGGVGEAVEVRLVVRARCEAREMALESEEAQEERLVEDETQPLDAGEPAPLRIDRSTRKESPRPTPAWRKSPCPWRRRASRASARQVESAT